MDKLDHAKAANLLLDYVKHTVVLKNDAAISRRLGVQPPTISKLRAGMVKLGPTLMLKLMEDFDISAKKIRYLIGDTYFDHCIWKKVAARGESQVRNSLSFELYPNQKIAAANMHESLARNGYAVLRAGQRAGKTTIVGEILRGLEFDILCVMTDGVGGEHQDWTWRKQPNQHILHNQMPVIERVPGRAQLDLNPKRVVVFIDEPFWKFGAHLTFQNAKRAGYKIIVAGSRGPEWDNCPFWRHLEGQAWNTWDLNPKCTRAMLEDKYQANAAEAKRDFEAF